MNRNSIAAMIFASLFFCILAVLNHFTATDLQANQEVTINDFEKAKGIAPHIIIENVSENTPQSTVIQNNEAIVAAYKKFLLTPPSYLKNTDIRGGFYLNEQKDLIITPSIKKRFDYFFLMTNHIPLPDIIKIIQGHLYNELTEPALSTANDLLIDYVDYFKQYNALLESHSPKDNHNVYQLAEYISQLRTDILGEQVSEIFFEKSQALRNQSLNRLATENNLHQFSTTTELPEDLKINQQATLSYSRSKQTINKALKEGASNVELQVLRTQLYSAEAALRLQKLDTQRAQWNQHLVNYQSLNQQLIQTNMSPQQISLQLNATFSQNHGLTELQISQLAAQASMSSIKK